MKKIERYYLCAVFAVFLSSCRTSGVETYNINCRETAEIFPKTSNRIFEAHCRYPCFKTVDDVQVWGTNIFSVNSSICKSALHDLRISIWNTNARDVRIRFKRFRGVNLGSVRFGYISNDLNAINGTLVFEFESPRITEDLLDIVSVHNDFLHGANENHTQYCFIPSNTQDQKMTFQPFKKRNLLGPQQFTQHTYSNEGSYNAFEYIWFNEESLEERSGGFQCLPGSSTLSSVTSIAFRSDAFFLPDKFSVTASISDTVILKMEEQEQETFAEYETTWMKDGMPLNEALFEDVQRTSLTIYTADISFAGIYSLEYKNHTSLRRGYIRLIIRTCPIGKFGNNCSENCPHCLNGGVCHDITGFCICAPGFNGSLCEKACNPGYFGKECNLKCFIRNEEQEFEVCHDWLLCLPDPYGCSCAAGFTGPFCNETCPPGFYGAGCNEKQVGRCEEGNYSIFSGLCEGACIDGWHGIFCNESYPVLTESPQLLNVSKHSVKISFNEWTNETGTGYGTPKYYQIIYKETADDSWHFGPEIEALEKTQNYEVDVINLSPGRQYFVAVIIRDISGNAQKNNISLINVTTICDSPSSPPTNILLYTHGKIINLKWKIPPPEKWNCWDVESVIILNKSQSNSIIQNKTKDLSYSFLSEAFITWHIQICLSPSDERTNDFTCSDFKSVTIEFDVPGSPQGGIAYQETNSSIAIKWEEPMITNNLTNYMIILIVVDSFNASYVGYRKHVVLNKNVRSFVFDNLLPATSFLLLIQAGNEAGYGTPLHVLTSTKKKAPVINVLSEILKPRGPEVVIKLSPVEISGISVSAYFIVIDPVNTNTSVGHVISDDIYQSMNCSSSVTKTSTYVAGKISYVPKNGTYFTIGTGVCENGYYNPPLKLGMTYQIGISVLLVYGQETLISDIKYIPELLKIEINHPQKELNILGISFGVLLPVSTIIIIVVLFYCFKKFTASDSSDINVKFFPSNEVVENEFSAYNEALDEMPAIETESVCEDFTNKIAVKDLLQYLKNNIQNNKIKNEFLSLPKGQIYPCNTARMLKNKPKSRYGNILPYDHSRVILDIIDDDPHSDYIHANYIDGYKKSNKYIATQGPIISTVKDFWRMVWKEKSSKILMTTNLVESGKVKCEKYWPDEVDLYGDISLAHQYTDTWADFTVRTFCISKGQESREIKHFHFTAWPDHGVPANTTPFINFLRKARAYRCTEAPVVIHCSAGIGRTGTIILLDSMIEMGQRENHVDLLEHLCAMRRQRMNIVENFDQYLFVHYALIEELCIGQTSIKCDAFKHEYGNLKRNEERTSFHLQKQFQMLHELCPHLLYKDMQAAYLLENYEKNRYMHILPADSARPFLTRNSDNTGYINAVFVDGYRWKNAYVATQYPLPQTIIDFWSMIYELKSAIIVLLQDIDFQDSKNPQLWPSADMEAFGNLHIECQSVTIEDNVIIRELSLKDQGQTEEQSLSVTIFQVVNWPATDDLPSDSSSLLSVLKKINLSQCELPHRTITVICLDGATACGIFCAALYLCDRIQSEQEVDVFQAVKCIRVNRPQFILNEGQYVFLFDFMEEYLTGS